MSAVSSPARERSLSPWSKIRAAALAPANSDSEQQGVELSSNRSPRPNGSLRSSSTSSLRAYSARSDGSNSETEGVITRPIGRLASRLARANPAKEEDDSKESVTAPRETTWGAMSCSDGSDGIDVSKETPVHTRRPQATIIPQRLSASPEDLARDASYGSPSPRRTIREDDSGSDIQLDRTSSRFQALIQKKRGERKQRDEARKSMQAEQHHNEASTSRAIKKRKHRVIDDEPGSDDEGIRRLTQNSRPSRKASKKALEEMHRETQRLARNQHLAHEARVKKKITTNDLFKLFDFQQEHGQSSQANSPVKESFKTSAAAVSSDAEGMPDADTAPSSPSSSPEAGSQKISRGAKVAQQTDFIIRTGADGQAILSEDDEPTLQHMMRQGKKSKGKMSVYATAPGSDLGSSILNRKEPAHTSKRTRISLTRLKKVDDGTNSDDDLEIVTQKPRKLLDVFQSLPTQKAHDSIAMLHLRALAGIKTGAPKVKKNEKSAATTSNIEMYRKLQEEARKQAMLDRQERLQELKARGIEVRTREEIEKEQLEFDSILDKAREEDRKLARQEKQSAGQDGEEPHHFGDSDDSDADFNVDEHAEDADADVELSSSEDEADDDGSEIEEEDEAIESNHTTPEEDQQMPVAENERIAVTRGESPTPVSTSEAPRRTTGRQRQVIIDEEDDDELAMNRSSRISPSARAQQAFAESPIHQNLAAFGFQNSKTSPLGLTQMFHGTMDDLHSQTQLAVSSADPLGSLGFLKGIGASTLPVIEPMESNHIPDIVVPNSQVEHSETLMPVKTPLRTMQERTPSGFDHFIDPTQDEGFQDTETPTVVGRNPQSTVETVIVPASSNIAAKTKNRLRRRASMIAELTDDEEKEDGVDELLHDTNPTTDAFDALFQGAKQKSNAENFDRKKSRAKAMVEEQADESEDEYAGLGGASEDDSDHEFDEDIADLIDENQVELREDKLAQLYADKERAADEKQVDKLYRDITTGALRRKRGADMDDLSDSEDEAAERRRRKQLEFARMRKALLEDEHLGKIAENPKKMAFLRAIEDRDEDAAYADFLAESLDPVESVPDSQAAAPESQVTATEADSGQMKEPAAVATAIPAAPVSVPVNKSSIPSMAHRRTAPDPAWAKARTLAEIKQSVSSLLDEPLVRDSQVSSESENDDDELEVEGETVMASRRVLGQVRASVINRLSMNRSDSQTSQTGHMAFQTTTSTTSFETFKVPSLLRRATTNMSQVSNASNTGVVTPPLSTHSSVSGGASGISNQENSGIRRGGNKKSNVHYQAREAERRKVVEAAERKRKEGVARRVKGLRKAAGGGVGSVLGLLGGGNCGFE